MGTTTKPEIAAIEQVFATVYETDSAIGVLARRAVDGFASENQLWQVMDTHGSKGARALLTFLTGLPGTVGRTDGQFAAGFAAHTAPLPEALVEWNAILSEAFQLALIDIDKTQRDRIPEACERLMKLIRYASSFASPRLRAWSP